MARETTGVPRIPQQRGGRHLAGWSRRDQRQAGRGAAGQRASGLGTGERHTAIALSALPEGWVVRHDVAWEEPAGFADHLVVGPNGVFAIDSQHWPDEAEVVDGVVWRRGRAWPWATSRALTSASQIADLLGGVGGVRDADVVAAVSLHGVGPVAGRAHGAVVASPTTLVRMLTDHPPVLTPAQVDAVVAHLDRTLRTDGAR